jgi:hypothetical protein
MPRRLWRRAGFRSGFEQRVHEKLKSIKKLNFGYEDIKFDYTTDHKYTPDFTLYVSNTKSIFVECKGRFTTADRMKILAVLKHNPNVDLRLLFQKDQPIRKGSKTLYSDWATKHNILWAEGEEVPKEWLKEK